MKLIPPSIVRSVVKRHTCQMIMIVSVCASSFSLCVSGCSDSTGSSNQSAIALVPINVDEHLILSDLDAEPGTRTYGHFELGNDGSTSKKLIVGKTSCTCLSLSMQDKEIALGDEIEIPAKSSVKLTVGRILQRYVGVQSHAVLLYPLSTREESPIALQGSVTILDILETKPNSVGTKFVIPASEEHLESIAVVCRSRDESQIQRKPYISGIPSGIRVVGVERTSTAKEIAHRLHEQAWSLKIGLLPEPGQKGTTTHKNVLDVTWNGQVRKVMVTRAWKKAIEYPDHVDVTVVPSDFVYRFSIHSAEPETTFQIREATCDVDSLRIYVDRTLKGNEHWLEIIRSDLHLTGEKAREGTISIATDHRGCERISIPLTARFLAGDSN